MGINVRYLYTEQQIIMNYVITRLADSLEWFNRVKYNVNITKTGLILGLRPANEKRRYKVTTSLIGWTQT